MLFYVNNEGFFLVVKDLNTQCIGATELHKQRMKIQELNDKTSIQLKRNVYQNYMQFIETAKEISHLESEMYQLSQLLSEQRSLLSALNSNRSTGAIFDNILKNHQDFNAVSKEQEQKQKLIQLLEHVEGGMVNVYRFLIHFSFNNIYTY